MHKYLLLTALILCGCSDYDGANLKYVECKDLIDVKDFDLARFTRSYVCERDGNTKICRSREYNAAGDCERIFVRVIDL